MSDDLPDEVVREILWRLPVDSIIRCRCVCKSWYSLITNPNFISTHLHKTLVSNNTQLFLHQEFSENASKNNLLCFDNQNHFECMPINLPSSFRVVGSCCGVVCMVHFEYDSFVEFILCNPSTGNCLSLPRPKPNLIVQHWLHTWLSGFGYDESSQDFKILFMIKYDYNIWDGQIYSLNSNTWRNITAPVPFIDYGFDGCPSTFVNGGLHWVVNIGDMNNSTNLVLAFDLKEETFAQISLPDRLKPRELFQLSVTKFGESSIAVVHQTWFEAYKSNIWVMKEYGAIDSWTKVATIGERVSGDLVVLGFINSNEALVKFESGYLASLTLDKNVVKNLVDVGKRLQFTFLYNYVPSLLLLDKDNTGAAMELVIKHMQSKLKLCI